MKALSALILLVGTIIFAVVMVINFGAGMVSR